MFKPDEDFTAVVIPGSPARTLLVQDSNRDNHYTYNRYDAFDVFEQVGDEYVLLTVADPVTEVPSPAMLAQLIQPRNQALGRLLDERRIVATDDYPDPSIYGELYGEVPPGRYVALTEDETYSFAWVCATIDGALSLLSGQAGQNTGGLVVGVYDLDADTLLETMTTVTLAPPAQGPPVVATPAPAPTTVDAYFAAQKSEMTQQATSVDWATWRERYSWTRADDITDREIYRGRSLADNGYDLRPPADFTLIDAWSTGYRVVWIGAEQRVILTYCEGDLSYEVSPDANAFLKAKRAAREFYKDH
jgi:hypothetical protein